MVLMEKASSRSEKRRWPKQEFDSSEFTSERVADGTADSICAASAATGML